MSNLDNGYKRSAEDVLYEVNRGLYFPQHKALSQSASGATQLWLNTSSSKRIVVTDIVLSAEGAVTVRFGFGPDETDITYPMAAIQLTASNLNMSITGLKTPLVAPSDGDHLYVTLSDAVQIGGFVAGYEI